MSETKYYEEDDTCSEKKCDGVYVYDDVEDCSCHLNPPCSACENNPLLCNKCGIYAYAKKKEK